MTRIGHVLAVAVTTALAGLSVADVAQAQPPPPCGFTLSPPQVVQVSGVDMVTATVAPDVCVPPAAPAQSVACLQMQAGDRVTRCYPSDASGRAQVYFEPYAAGATYVATGRGCSLWLGQMAAQDCQVLGPYSATL